MAATAIAIGTAACGCVMSSVDGGTIGPGGETNGGAGGSGPTGAVTTTTGRGGATGAGGAPVTTPPPPAGIWQPRPGMSWQWQLTGAIDINVDAEMFDLDLFDTTPDMVTTLHARGRKVVCYMSAGSFEDWRPDASRFSAAVKGKALDGWPGEAWLDIRQIDALRPIIEARLDMCRSKGFDGVEFDNVDGYLNPTGFPLGAADQLRYNRFLAEAAHARGLSAGLKNDLDQVPDLVGSFDWALSEECFAYDECELLAPFIKTNKAVFEVEYEMSASAVCSRAKNLRFSTLIKNLNLDARREACH